MPAYRLNPLHRGRFEKSYDSEKGYVAEAGTRGDIYYLDTDDDRWYLADASSEDTSAGLLGVLSNTSASIGDTGSFITRGTFKAQGLDKGDIYYLSTTAGAYSDTQPTEEDEVLRVLGEAKSSTELLFDPSKDYFTLTTAIDYPIEIITGDTTLTADQETILVDASSGPVTVSLLATSAINGKVYNIKKIDSTTNQVIIDPYGSELINDDTTLIIECQHSCADIQAEGTTTNEWYII